MARPVGPAGAGAEEEAAAVIVAATGVWLHPVDQDAFRAYWGSAVDSEG